MIDQDEGEQLRRRLRALSAVNEQLRAQLEATQAELRTTPRRDEVVDPLGEPGKAVPVGLATRRATVAAAWLQQLPEPEPGERAELVETDDGALFVVEGRQRRRLRSGLLAAAVEALLGERRGAAGDELSDLPEAAPVEVLEGGTGLPFVVLGRRRLPVRGLPLPHPVPGDDAERLPLGPDLDVAAATTARRAHEADGWIATLSGSDDQGPSHLAAADDGTVVLVEGTRRRAIPSLLLVPALEQLLGAPRSITADELAALEEGPPVATLEAGTGEPFVVLGGRRCRVHGFPLPYPVHQQRADSLTDGPVLDVSAAHRADRRALVDDRNRALADRDRATRKVDRVQAELDKERRLAARRRANPDPMGELRKYLDKRGGLLPATAGAVQKRLSKAKKVVRR